MLLCRGSLHRLQQCHRQGNKIVIKKKASPIFVANEKKVSGLAEWKAAEGHTQICFRQQTGIFSVFLCGSATEKSGLISSGT